MCAHDLSFSEGGGAWISSAASSPITSQSSGVASNFAYFADYNLDGLVDLFVCNGYTLSGGTTGHPLPETGRSELYRNNGNGGMFVQVTGTALTEHDASEAKGGCRGAAWGDYGPCRRQREREREPFFEPPQP